ARDEQTAADVEKQVILAALVADVAFAFAQQASQLAHRLLWKDRLVLGVSLRARAVARHGDERETMTVCGHQAHLAGAQDEQRAVQEKPRVFPGDRKLRLGDHLFHGASSK